MDTPTWDTELPPEAVKRLRPEDKGRRAVTSLTRKVETLERWGRNGIPAGMAEAVPWDRAKLRRWADVRFGLWPWADPQVDAKDGRNAALMERFRRALEVLEVRAKDRGANLKRELEAKDRIIANLERQNADLLDQVRQLQKMVGVEPVVRR
ncbi:hypothetical protein C1S70_24620 (plasmid) [Azospirillum argentinense]|uniref:Uncharacterized protein n=1 Tax=Azospirillum argentinense TaxID=2970906 RepID=A0A2K1FUJ1_9PROT|nr:hypothetical protein [Azospirillum argentinense]PNQ96196.1 hypothetical protein C1S70_24620 [Azospirillum argentinense]